MRFETIIISFAIFCLITSCKQTPEQLIDNGKALENKGKFKEAIEVYTKVISKNDKIQLAYLSPGFCYLNSKEYSKALNDFNTILKLKSPAGGDYIINLNPEIPIEEAKFQVSYDDGIYGRAQARYWLDSFENSYEDFQDLIKRNFREKVFCILFQADIWYTTGNDSLACAFVQRAKKIAKRQDEIEDCISSAKSYCKTIYDR